MFGEEHLDNLTTAVNRLAHELHHASEQQSLQTILCRLDKLEKNIMEAIVNYSNRVNAAFDAIGTSVDEIVASQVGITADVAGLKDIIAKLQTTPGTLTPEDQALLDAAEARATTLATKTAAVSAAMKALDEATETPPAPPV